jgi:Transcriptional regulatory protein, C terminal
MDEKAIKAYPSRPDMPILAARPLTPHPRRSSGGRDLLVGAGIVAAATALAAQFAFDPAYLRVYMGQLRSKLEPDPARPRFLITEPGVGYRLQLEEETSRSSPPSQGSREGE